MSKGVVSMVSILRSTAQISDLTPTRNTLPRVWRGTESLSRGFGGVPQLPRLPPRVGGYRGLKLGYLGKGRGKLSQTLLLTGAPGTGKTAIIREAITESKAGGLYIDCIVA